MSSNNPRGGYFDLVLDKSTLDCLLCAEMDVVARFLHKVYQALGVPASTDNDPVDAPPSSWGEIYALVMFHLAKSVERLLTHLPGTDWHVEHEVIRWGCRSSVCVRLVVRYVRYAFYGCVLP